MFDNLDSRNSNDDDGEEDARCKPHREIDASLPLSFSLRGNF